MKNHGKAAMSDFVEDHMLYRNLTPIDPRLESLRPQGNPPRKHEPAYAQLVTEILQCGREISAPGTKLQRLIFLGDTRMSDAGAFNNLCLAGNWQGLSFIGAEDSKPAALECMATSDGYPLYLGNRWLLLAEFERQRQSLDFPVDEETVVVLDMDKTTLGARGRNAAVIDRARLQAVRQTVAGVVGAGFDPGAFLVAYERLGHPQFHPFTADNQDYLAYICLILGSGLYNLDELIARLQYGSLQTFVQFIGEVDELEAHLPGGMAEVHAEIYAYVRAGDPTPFKSFRRNEYLTTAALIGCLPDDSPVEKLLSEEIVLTAEVRAVAEEWKRQGALLFGLSDKPDEASVPTPELAVQGWQPLHRMRTHVVGE